MSLRTLPALAAGCLLVPLLAALQPAATSAATPVATSAAPAPATSAAEPAARAPLDWGRCRDEFLASYGGQCAKLEVPLDHADTDGPTITLAVSRVRHTTKRSRGVVFTNPGGPGSGGTWMAAYGQFVPDGVGRSYDWYGMDPRGVGASRPALSCDPDAFGLDRPPYEPITERVRETRRAMADAYADACADSEHAELLPHLRSTDTIADFELLRQAVGADTITFYGASYGTYLGQLYATLHPDVVDAMLLDGVIDPDRVWYDSNLDQDRAFQATVGQRFFRWVARNRRTFHLGGTRAAVARSYAELSARVTRRPIGRVGPAELSDALLLAGYGVGSWPAVADAMESLQDGDARRVKNLYRALSPAGEDNGYAIYLATICTDTSWPTDWETWDADMAEVAQDAPLFTWNNAWYNAPCRSWPAPSAERITVDGSGFDGPVLLLSETYDGATPISGARRVRQLFPTSVLIEGEGGATHSAALSGIGCVDGAIADLLRDGSLPRRKDGDVSDKLCPGLEPPGPGVLGRPTAPRPGPVRR